MQIVQGHPKNEVLGLVDRSDDVEGILHDVEERGISPRDVHVIGRDDKGSDKWSVHAHKGLAHSAEMLSEEHEFNEFYESRLSAGGYLVGVPVSGAVDKHTAHDILRDHGGHDISYYGRWVVEELGD